MHILSSAEYRALVRQEVMSALNSADTPDSEDPLTRLDSVKIQALETEMPVLDSCIRETIRVYLTGILVRMNTGQNDVVLQTTEDGRRETLLEK